ncbi:MAG TPA: gamma-glutamyl-gamma-aminobutyrate hydrolase family protein [Gemmataceae bacterium]|nr:gamma-glutamyl-gamma-aminobutyrate hydrolase family protein [Gemmataceae bacterium]
MARQTRPFIGINADFIAAGKLTNAHVRLNAGYFDAVLAAGGLPVIMPPLGKDAEINAFLDRVDGMLMTGGLDLDPKRQWLPSHPAVHPMDPRREDNDKVLDQRIIARQVPVLAAGVGMHQLNVACGGSLFLHLPEEQPRALPHFDSSGGPHRHAVLLEPNTRLDEIYGGGEIRVNSSHHQAVRQVGSRLRVSALAPDGIIEGIEAADPNWFCIGVQWQPESETASALDMQLFECFVQACIRQSQPLELAA